MNAKTSGFFKDSARPLLAASKIDSDSHSEKSLINRIKLRDKLLGRYNRAIFGNCVVFSLDLSDIWCKFMDDVSVNVSCVLNRSPPG